MSMSNEQVSALEKEIKDRMNQVYFGYIGRVQTDGLDSVCSDKSLMEKVVFSYFQALLDDHPDIITFQPIAGVSEERKLYGAFSGYADFVSMGYNIMERHRGDSKLGIKIINKLRKSTLTWTSDTPLAFGYILGKHHYDQIRMKYQGQRATIELINGAFKNDVIEKVKELFNVT